MIDLNAKHDSLRVLRPHLLFVASFGFRKQQVFSFDGMFPKRAIVFLILLFCGQDGFARFDFTQLGTSDFQVVKQKLHQVSSENRHFNKIYRALEVADYEFTITIRPSKHLAFFSPSCKGGNINFSSLAVFEDVNALIEEFFHAFQHVFYRLPIPLTQGGSNVEYEAKLFRAIVLIEQGLPMNETPSQKGLLDFVLEILGDDGRFHLKQFSQQQSKNYIACVRHFQQHWVERNRNENEENIYAQEVIEHWMPDAVFFICSPSN